MENGTITLAHGSGGKDSEELMEKIFGKYFSNEVLDKMEDGAVLDMPKGKMVVSTDSFVVTPLEFRGGNIGKLSVCGTVNDLLMMGATPKYLTCGFILEEGLSIEVLERIVKSMSETLNDAGVKIVAGDTKVIEGNGGLCINTTGVGFIEDDRNISAANCKDGDAIIVSGNLGDHHVAILSERMEIENGIKSDCAVLSEITDALFNNNIDVHTMRDITRGGLGTILNEIADTSSKAIIISEESLPVDQEVKGFSGIMGLEPLYMGNEGKMLAVISGDDAEEALEILKKTELAKDAKIVGYVEEGSGVYSKTKIGGTRKVDVLYGEGLPRIC